jgi:hypothetical protein
MTKARTLADNFAADINGITAGTGITGGGTSGTVTVTNSMATAIDAKGDLVVGTGADTFSRLAVASTAGYLLSVDSAESTGLKWAAPAGGGKVLQVVQSTSTSITSNSTNTFADATGLSVTITPSSATSKVLIQLTHQIYMSSADALNALELRILRGATNIHKYGTELGQVNTGVKKQLQASAIYLDSPATTSATTYKVQFANYINGAAVAINDPASTMVMIATEIGA